MHIIIWVLIFLFLFSMPILVSRDWHLMIISQVGTTIIFAISFNQINNLSNNETKIKVERGDENANKKKEKLNKKNENVIDLKNFKK